MVVAAMVIRMRPGQRSSGGAPRRWSRGARPQNLPSIPVTLLWVELQVWDTPEMPVVPGDEGQVVVKGGGGDEEIHVWDEQAAFA
jgi:hypothetical protein